MIKYAALATVVLGIAAASLPASAQSENAAVVITRDNACGGFVPSPTGGFGPGLRGDLHSVSTSSGVTSLVCKFDIPAAFIPDTARRAEGFLCGTFLGLTTDSKMVATPGGQATLICKINGQ